MDRCSWSVGPVTYDICENCWTVSVGPFWATNCDSGSGSNIIEGGEDDDGDDRRGGGGRRR